MAIADEGRQLVADRGLTPAAVAALIPLMSGVGFEELGAVKAHLRRFFSDAPWTAIDAAALSRAVGPPPEVASPMSRHRLDPELTLIAGWVDGTFVLDVERTGPSPDAEREQGQVIDLGRTFDYGVIPEPTPNPRTLRFATADRSEPVSRGYKRADAEDDERVARIFAIDGDIADVLVGSDFVAVSLRRASRWPELLEPVLAVIDAEYGADTADDVGSASVEDASLDVRGASRTTARASERRQTRLDRAWAELGGLDANDDAGRQAILAAAKDRDGARRQVAARVLMDAPADIALAAWRDLLIDTSRAVRRATLDAVVDTEREDVRPLLELALADADAWMRWKALHGLVVIGVDPSRASIEPLGDDPDFRVRLEATNARRERA